MTHLMLERVYQGGRDGIVNMQEGDGILSVLLEQEMSRTFVNPKYVHKLIPFPDAQPFPLDKIIDGALWVEKFLSEHKDKQVLVHCAEGNSRSIAVILALLLGRGKKLEEAINHIVTVKNMCTEGGRYVHEKQIDRINKSWGDFPKNLESYLHGIAVKRYWELTDLILKGGLTEEEDDKIREEMDDLWHKKMTEEERKKINLQIGGTGEI